MGLYTCSTGNKRSIDRLCDERQIDRCQRAGIGKLTSVRLGMGL